MKGPGWGWAVAAPIAPASDGQMETDHGPRAMASGPDSGNGPGCGPDCGGPDRGPDCSGPDRDPDHGPGCGPVHTIAACLGFSISIVSL